MRALSKVLLPRKRRPGVIAARKARHLRARTDGTAATSPPLVSARTTRTRTHARTHATPRARDTHTTRTRRITRAPQSTSSPRGRPPSSRAPSPRRAVAPKHQRTYTTYKTPITSHTDTHTTYYTPQPCNMYRTPHHAIVGARIRYGANPRWTTKTPVFRDPAAGSRSVDWCLSQSTRGREGYPRCARDFATHGDDDAVLHPARDDDDGDRRVED